VANDPGSTAAGGGGAWGRPRVDRPVHRRRDLVHLARGIRGIRGMVPRAATTDRNTYVTGAAQAPDATLGGAQ